MCIWQPSWIGLTQQVISYRCTSSYYFVSFIKLCLRVYELFCFQTKIQTFTYTYRIRSKNISPSAAGNKNEMINKFCINSVSLQKHSLWSRWWFINSKVAGASCPTEQAIWSRCKHQVWLWCLTKPNLQTWLKYFCHCPDFQKKK